MRASVLRSGSPRQRAWASRVFLVVIVSALVGWTLIPLGRVIWRPATSYSGLEAANILKNISAKDGHTSGGRAAKFEALAARAESQAPLVACPAPWDWTLGQVDASKGPVCDSGMARAAYRLLDLATGEGKLMGLEWGTGTLTPLFLQGKLAGLVSIEHNATVAEIAARVKQTLAQENATQLESRWAQRTAPLPDGSEPGEALQAYLDLVKDGKPQYQVIGISGPAAIAALERSVALLVPKGGIIMMLGQGEAELQAATALAPGHWPRHHSGTARRWTLIWLSCSAQDCHEK
uniref:Uncharacterized protein n=1 Tax=Auxenochlorella protothecoides TaxID=3075 RepID=A0A1D2A2U2_AUXPR